MARDALRPWPLVGRERQLEVARSALSRSPVTGISIVGEAGVGKTSLASRVMQLALDGGRRTAWTSATRAAARVPFGAFAHLFPIGPRPGKSTENIIRAAADQLVGENAERALALTVDDAHALDELSAALVHHLAMQTSAFVVITQRAGEPVPDAIARLWKERAFERLELEPLTEREVGDLLETVLGSRVDRGTQQRIFEQTLGNPLLLRELVVAGLDSGALRRGGPLWRWEGPILPSGRLGELIDHRLSELSRAAQLGLEVVALAEPIPVSTLEAILDRGVLTELERAGIVEEMLDGARRLARIVQPLHAARVRSRIPPARAREVASAHDEALGATGARRKQDVPLATKGFDPDGSEHLGLTPREHEVARLASSGLSNKQISERLHLSVRTVDNHLYRVYRRLGVGGRRDLAQVLQRGPAEPVESASGIEHRLLREASRPARNRDVGS